MTKAVYSHPDGHAIAFDGSALHFGDEDAGTYGRVPIGYAGLVELGKTLQALGRTELARQTRQTAALKKAAIRHADLALAKRADRERNRKVLR